jgi:hypothetical protein
MSKGSRGCCSAHLRQTRPKASQALVGQTRPSQAAVGQTGPSQAAVEQTHPREVQADVDQTRLGSTAFCKTDMFKAGEADVGQTRPEAAQTDVE